jgi:hypothetical protein
MLTQLSNLSIEADGRYASDRELKFLKDYFETVETRISAYEKIRDAEETIFKQVEIEKKNREQTHNEKLSYIGSEDRSETCLRDMRNILRRCATTALFNDLDRMREAALLWYVTIVRSFNYDRGTKVMYVIIDQIVKTHLSADEAEVVKPAMQLSTSILRG